MSFGDDTLDPSNVDVKRCNLDSGTLDTTVDEWQEAIGDAYIKCDAEGRTLMELSEELQIPETTMRRHILKLLSESRCTSGTGFRMDRRGRFYNVMVYQLTPKKEKK